MTETGHEIGAYELTGSAALAYSKVRYLMVALYTVCRFGLAARVTNDTRELLGREPLDMARFAQDYREAFLPERAGVAGTRSQRAHNRQLDARHERGV